MIPAFAHYRAGLRMTLARSLPDAQVFEADGAEHALAHVRAHPETDLALIDVRMAGTDGFNLLSNAIRYTDRGCVVVALRAAGRSMRVQVRDSGRGIAAHEHKDIFTEFYQSGSPPLGVGQGTGLGLATVRRLADAAGIGATLRSCPGQGSSFTLHMVATDAPHATDVLDTTDVPPTTTLPSHTPSGQHSDPDVLQGAVAWVIDDAPAQRRCAWPGCPSR